MKKFIKIISFVLAIATVTASSFLLLSCKKENKLISSIIELRQNVYESDGKDYKLSASYGYKKENEQKIFKLTFKLFDKESDSATYSVCYDYNGLTYKEDFALDSIKNCLVASFQIENFNEKSFTVKIMKGSLVNDVLLYSILPENCIDYKTALNCFMKNEKVIVEHYTNGNGELTVDLIMRVIVKNNKPFWYLGLIKPNGSQKALLIDGTNGDTLAIREVF